jgi:hypothetical protein
MLILTKEKKKRQRMAKQTANASGPGNQLVTTRNIFFVVAGIPAFLRSGDTAMERARVQVHAPMVHWNSFESLWSCWPCPALGNPVAFLVNFLEIHW